MRLVNKLFPSTFIRRKIARALDTGRGPYFDRAPFLTWTGDSTRSMTAVWSSLDPAPREVTCTRRGEAVTGRSRSHPFAGTRLFVHTALVESLEPGAEHELALEGERRRYRFRTIAESPESMRFVVGGDMFQNRLLFERFCKLVRRERPDFLVLGGDLPYAMDDARPELVWLDWLYRLKRYTTHGDGWIVPLLTVIGNHDVVKAEPRGVESRAPHYYSLFPPGFPGYRVVDLGDTTSVFLLDSNHGVEVLGKQTEWLAEQLRVRAERRHLFAVYHAAAYPCKRRLGPRQAEASERLRANWGPLFETYGVRTVFEHHDHAYKRSFPLRQQERAADGVVYIGGGCWGVRAKRVRESEESLAVTRRCANVVLVAVTGTTVRLDALSWRGRMFDQSTRDLGAAAHS